MTAGHRREAMAGRRSSRARVVDTVRGAFALLTRLPVGQPARETTGAAAFPLVGALVGAAGGAVCLLLASAEPVLAAVLAIGAMALVSGGLHLDGLADTTDALLARDATAAEVARRDPSIGAGGAVALIIVVGAQIAALAGIAAGQSGPTLAAASCVVAAASGRLVPVVVARIAVAQPGEGGFGAWFRDRISPIDSLVATGSCLLLVTVVWALTRNGSLPLSAAVGATLGGAALAAIASRRGRLDGDALGASIELTVAAVLGVIAVVT